MFGCNAQESIQVKSQNFAHCLSSENDKLWGLYATTCITEHPVNVSVKNSIASMALANHETKFYVVLTYEVVSNHCKSYHVHDWPGRTRAIDSRQLIPFTFSVQAGQLASPMNMTILTMVG